MKGPWNGACKLSWRSAHTLLTDLLTYLLTYSPSETLSPFCVSVSVCGKACMGHPSIPPQAPGGTYEGKAVLLHGFNNGDRIRSWKLTLRLDLILLLLLLMPLFPTTLFFWVESTPPPPTKTYTQTPLGGVLSFARPNIENWAAAAASMYLLPPVCIHSSTHPFWHSFRFIHLPHSITLLGCSQPGINKTFTHVHVTNISLWEIDS